MVNLVLQKLQVEVFLLAIGGVLGIHKFAVGKTGMGILYLFTGGLFGIGVLVDWVIVLSRLSKILSQIKEA